MGLTPAPRDELPVGRTDRSRPAGAGGGPEWVVSNELRLAEPTEGEEGALVGPPLCEAERRLLKKKPRPLVEAAVEAVWVLDGGGE